MPFRQYSLIKENGYTFTIVYSSKCESGFLNQMLQALYYRFSLRIGILNRVIRVHTSHD